MAMDPISDIRPGLPVYTRDGEQLGEIKEVHDTVFKVDAPMQPDYWLPRDSVLSFTIERVTMKFDKDRLADHRTGQRSAGS